MPALAMVKDDIPDPPRFCADIDAVRTGAS
jgi:hypothetical protein